MFIRNTMTHDKESDLNACGSRNARRRFNISRCVLACVLAGLISGCAITQDYQRPEIDIPQGWRVSYQEAANLADTAWWEIFQDPVLDELIKTALNENKDLRIASARVEEFAARLQISRSGFYPQVDYGGSASRDKLSLEGITPLAPSADRTNSIYQAILNVNWELDIWGRIQRETEAARARLLSTEEGRQAVILTLVSAVASSYLNLLSLQKQLKISRQTLAYREEWLNLFENKRKGGQISELELAQVRSEYEQTATSIPVLERQIALQENSLSVLLGKNPGPIKRDKTLDKLVMPEIPQGIPSDLLVRRPDIQQSEQNLIAANARIGVARTQYFPAISLTGLFGYTSVLLSGLLQDSANLWSVGAGAVGPIFTGGRIKGEVHQAEARQQQLLNDYLNTIQTAFREVNDALVSIVKFRELLKTQGRNVSALNDYDHFARNSYDAGYSSYLTVIDAERKLYNAEIRYAQIQGDLFVAIVSIYKAMGGGWITEAAKQIEPPR